MELCSCHPTNVFKPSLFLSCQTHSPFDLQTCHPAPVLSLYSVQWRNAVIAPAVILCLLLFPEFLAPHSARLLPLNAGCDNTPRGMPGYKWKKKRERQCSFNHSFLFFTARLQKHCYSFSPMFHSLFPIASLLCLLSFISILVDILCLQLLDHASFLHLLQSFKPKLESKKLIVPFKISLQKLHITQVLSESHRRIEYNQYRAWIVISVTTTWKLWQIEWFIMNYLFLSIKIHRATLCLCWKLNLWVSEMIEYSFNFSV